MNIDKLMVKSFFSLEEFAVFSNGSYELPVLQVFSGSLFTVMIPKLKKLKEDDRIADVCSKLETAWRDNGNNNCSSYRYAHYICRELHIIHVFE